jgi:hypothetical protein
MAGAKKSSKVLKSICGSREGVGAELGKRCSHGICALPQVCPKELLKKKQSGEKIEAPRQREPAKVISLMHALRRSVDAERGGSGKSERRPAAHRRTPKKTGRASARQKRAG